MKAHDIPNAARDLDLHRRAMARCIVAEPHLDADEDAPCSGCLLAAARSLAIPAAHVLPTAASTCIGGPAATGAVDGVVGRVRRSATTPPSTNNRPRVITPRPAEGAAATARNEGTR